MRLCNIFIQYFLLIYFCFSHDLNHADPVTVKQSITIDPIIETTNVQKTGRIIDDSNDITSPSTPVQTPPSIIDTVKNISVSNDQSNLSDPTTDNESHPAEMLHSSTTRYPQKVHIHPRHIQTEDTIIPEDTYQSVTIENKIQTNDLPNAPIEVNHSLLISTVKSRQICWHLPKKFQPSIELLENQLFRLINIFPEFLQTIFFGRIDDREVLMNTMWFGSICTMCFLFSFLFLSMGTKRLKQTKQEKEVRSRCQQLQQHNNQIQLERATFERQNQKLFEQIDELKSLPVHDQDEDLFALRTECTRFEEDLRTVRIERDTLQQDIDQKQNLILKYEYEMKGQVEMVAHLNNQILQLKQELEKERTIVKRLQSNDLSLERFEKSQEIIQELKSEIIQLKQEKFTDKDRLQEFQTYSNQLDMEKHQLTMRMKQLKDLLEQRNQTIKHLHEKIQTLDHFESKDLLSILNENSSDENFLSIIDNDIKKSNQHIHDLHSEINEKTRRIKEIDILLKQEKDHCREIETKLKVVLELRERDAHLHIRQLGQTDAELRKARTDADRVRIQQQQLELKKQEFDDVQKVLSSEQMKFKEEYSKLEHEAHEKWMEVKRLTRELDASKKECEGLRKQITKYASQEKTMIKPILLGDSERNSISPIDHQRNDSGATSPAEMLMPRPPLFGLSRPPFFMGPHHPSNPFMMHPRFPMPTPGPHGMISPIAHLTVNGGDGNSSQMIDLSNLTPNSISCDAQLNGGLGSPVVTGNSDENQLKTKKPKKSLKKKSRISAMKEDV